MCTVVSVPTGLVRTSAGKGWGGATGGAGRALFRASSRLPTAGRGILQPEPSARACKPAGSARSVLPCRLTHRCGRVPAHPSKDARSWWCLLLSSEPLDSLDSCCLRLWRVPGSMFPQGSITSAPADEA